MLAARNLLRRFFAETTNDGKRIHASRSHDGGVRGRREQAINTRFEGVEDRGGVASDQRHDSAHKHVTGQAVYIDDMPEPAGTLPGASVERRARCDARYRCLGGAERARRVDVLLASDARRNDISPTWRHDEPVLAEGKVQFSDSRSSLRSLERARRRAAPAGWPRSPMTSCRRSSILATSIRWPRSW
jgi:hypothetical protein